MARDQAPTNEIDFGDGLTPEAGSQLTVLDAVGAEALTVPGGTMLLTADFSREGPDLLLTGDGGEEVLVRDYFSVETSPNLLTDGGAQITPQVAQALSGSLAPDQYAQATTTDGDAQPIGTVDTADGDVFAIRTDGARVELEVGDPVFQGDVIETGDIGALEMTFVDGTNFALDESARMVLDEMIYDPGTGEGSSAFTVVQGVFSFVSGSIAKSGSDAMTVDTPVATIGIRGTKVAIKAGAEGEDTIITLLEEEGGYTGEITITNEAGTQILNVANQTVFVESAFLAPTAPVVLPSEQLRSIFNDSDFDVFGSRVVGGAEDDSEGGDGIEGVDGVGEESEGVGEESEGEGEEGEGEEGEGEEEEEVEGEEEEEEAVAEAEEEGAEEEAVAEAEPEETEAESAAAADDAGDEDLEVAEAAAEVAFELALAEGDGAEDAQAAADAAFEAALEEGSIDSLIETAAGGDDSGFGPADDVGLGTGSPLGVDGNFGGGGNLDFDREIGGGGPGFGPGAAGPPDDRDDEVVTETADPRILGSEGDDVLLGTAGADVIEAGGGDDTIIGVEGDDIIDGGTGNDTISGAGGDDIIVGGEGSDTVSFVEDTAGVQVDLGAGTATGAGTGTDTITEVENVAGGAGDDIIIGDEFDNVLDGGAGNDTIIGLESDDVIIGGTGNDFLYAGAGDDIVDAGPGDDIIVGGSGQGNDTYIGGEGNDTITYTSTSEGITVDLAPDGVTVDLSTGIATGIATGGEIDTDILSGIENVVAGDGDDTIIGDANANVLEGGLGNDTIAGGAGDTLDGGDGTDTLRVQVGHAEFDDPSFQADIAAYRALPPGSEFEFESIGLNVDNFETFEIEVDGQIITAQAPDLTIAPSAGAEDTAIALNISAGVGDTEGRETLSDVTISGVPDGATLSAGTFDSATGDWTLSADELVGLTMTPPQDFSGGVSLTMSATSTEVDGSTATGSSTFVVAVSGVADDPTLAVNDVSGAEDTAIALNIRAGLTDPDGSEQLSVTISGIPDGATISVLGTNVTFSDGAENNEITVFGTPEQLADLSITPPPDSSDDFTLTVTAAATEDGTIATASAELAVSVSGVADTPVVTVTDQTGAEDTSFALNIGAAIGDLDGSESLTVTISGVPVGATLSAGTLVSGDEGEDILFGGDGEGGPFFTDPDGTGPGTQTYTVSAADLVGLTITPPADFNGAFSLQVTAIATEEGTTAQTVSNFNFTVDPVNDVPVAFASTISGGEDSGSEDAGSLTGNLVASDVDATDTLSFSLGTGAGDAPQFGSVTIATDGSYSYAPSPAMQGLAVGESQTDSFTYEVSDGQGGTDTATVTVTITGSNDGPVAEADSGTTAEDAGSLTGNLVASDVDATDTLSFSLGTGAGDAPQFGSVTIATDGSYSYAPSPAMQGLAVGESQTDSFTYEVSDGQGGTDTATVTVTITGSNDGPVATGGDDQRLGRRGEPDGQPGCERC